MTDRTFTVVYRPFRNPSTTATVVATAKPDHLGWYAVAPGAGCSKTFATPGAAVWSLVDADLGDVVSVS